MPRNLWNYCKSNLYYNWNEYFILSSILNLDMPLDFQKMIPINEDASGRSAFLLQSRILHFCFIPCNLLSYLYKYKLKCPSDT